MSDSRRTFIGKILAAFSLPAFVTKIFGFTVPLVKVLPPIKPPVPEIMPSMHVLDQTWGTKDFRHDMTQMEWLVKSSARRIHFDGVERVTPGGWRMKRTPNVTMMKACPGYQMENTET